MAEYNRIIQIVEPELALSEATAFKISLKRAIRRRSSITDEEMCAQGVD